MDVEILPLQLATLTLPDSHPEGPGPCHVSAFAIREPDSVVLVDTGVGSHAGIDRLYAPVRTPLEDALAGHGIRLTDVTAVVNTHLHFDHCGNNASFRGVPIFVQRAELEAARAELYTIAEWIEFEGADYTPLEGAAAVSSRVSVVPTPGHTPGHQSVRIQSSRGVELIVAQAAYTAAEFAAAAAGEFPGLAANSYDDASYVDSLRALVGLSPARAYFSHDPAVWEPQGSHLAVGVCSGS